MNDADQHDVKDDEQEQTPGTTQEEVEERVSESFDDPREEPDEETKQDIEEERARRLDPDNRPDDVEVDNTQREFDVDRGMFTDNDDYDPDAPAPFSDPENPNSPKDADDESSDEEQEEEAS